MITPKIDLVGHKYGRLTVISQAEDIVYNNVHYTAWNCKCDCGNDNIVVARGKDLRSGYKQSCGCITRERLKKYNIYDLSGSYGIGITYNTNIEFWFDIEDYEKIKDYCWFESDSHYIIAKCENNKHIRLSRLVMDVVDTDGRKVYIDHIGGSDTKYDNRKCNLRVATPRENAMNSKKSKNNTSGTTGVFRNNNGAWMVIMRMNGKNYFFGNFNNYDDAVNKRKQIEEEYYGEWSYDNSQNYYHDLMFGGEVLSESLD